MLKGDAVIALGYYIAAGRASARYFFLVPLFYFYLFISFCLPLCFLSSLINHLQNKAIMDNDMQSEDNQSALVFVAVGN